MADFEFMLCSKASVSFLQKFVWFTDNFFALFVVIGTFIITGVRLFSHEGLIVRN